MNHDLENTVFSYIPNTAEVAFGGLVEGIDSFSNANKAEQILNKKGNLNKAELEKILHRHPRIHKVVIKDAKQRTFITDDESRDSLM
ncbi:MAG: amidophosphoribosyltransferase, partial [Candidatus Paceibacterales bacterium]